MYSEKMLKLLFFILLPIGFVNSQQKEIKKGFIDNNIVPGIVDYAPKRLAHVSYPSGVTVNLGNDLTPTQVKDMPEVTWSSKIYKLYTLLKVGPNPPPKQNFTEGQVRHWLVVNIPSKYVDKGKTLIEYLGALPPQNSGISTYVFLIFEQKGLIPTAGIPVISNRTAEGRLYTNTRELIRKFNLQKLVAGNFYKTQYEEYVSEVYAELGVDF